MTKLFLPPPDPYSTRRRADDEPPWEDEYQSARQQGARWAREFFEPYEVAEWLRRWPTATPTIAAEFQRRGVSPQLATTRLWYGKVNSGRRMLADRVAAGDLTVDEAAHELREAGFLDT